MEDLSGILRNHPFMKDLDENYLKQITGCASNVAYHEDEIIFREGDKAEKFYLIRTGKVALEINGRDKGNLRILTVGPGQILGECLRNKCEDDPKMGYEMLKRFSHILEQRLQSTRMQLLDVYKRV